MLFFLFLAKYDIYTQQSSKFISVVGEDDLKRKFQKLQKQTRGLKMHYKILISTHYRPIRGRISQNSYTSLIHPGRDLISNGKSFENLRNIFMKNYDHDLKNVENFRKKCSRVFSVPCIIIDFEKGEDFSKFRERHP